MRHLIFASCIATTAIFVPPALAEEEFGCKVLLCAASENPSWRSVPYCVPVMAKLYSMMNAWSFTWPSCLSAGTGAPGFEPYDDCPTGWTASTVSISGSSSGVMSVGGQSGVQHICQRRNTSNWGCQNGLSSFSGGNRNDSQSCIETIPRPMRADPYYFDIPEYKRVFFNVR